MTREEEEKKMQEFIEKNGIKKLPDDPRLDPDVMEETAPLRRPVRAPKRRGGS